MYSRCGGALLVWRQVKRPQRKQGAEVKVIQDRQLREKQEQQFWDQDAPAALTRALQQQRRAENGEKKQH